MKIKAMSMLTVVATTLALASGCATSIAPNPDTSISYDAELDRYTDLPRARMGALPFEGPFTLFDAPDPDDLGVHAYEAGPLDIDDEVERGIVYTRRGGFLDIAHVRNSIDMTAYVHARARLAIQRGWDEFAFRGNEPSTYRVQLCYPEDWLQMDADERHALGEELALRIAQRVAFDVMTWHEIITWHGYKSTIIIPENNSAFTYDDVPSHALGVQIAGEAIARGGDFDQEVTRILAESLEELGVVEKDELKAAMRQVEGQWWDALGGPKRRLLDIGASDGLIEPWVVDGHGDDVHTFRVVQMDDVQGRDFSGFCRVLIDPNVLEGFAVRRVIGEDREYIDPETDFPVLVADIAESLEVERVEELPEHAIRR